MADDVPLWAFDRIGELCRYPKAGWHSGEVMGDPDEYRVEHAFARYIVEHEDPPLGPLLTEARAIFAEKWAYDADDAARAQNGGADSSRMMLALLAALKRGMELAK